MDRIKLSDTLKNSPSVELLRKRNREMILLFFIDVFEKDSVIPSEIIHDKLENYLEEENFEADEESEIMISDSYEDKAKKYIQKWADNGFLTNYQNESGEIFYELSSYSSKTIDWLSNLKKEEYIGTESKFKTLFNQLKELVEFTSEDKEKRLQILEDKKLEIEQQIQRIKMGEDVKVFEEYEIVPRFNTLNKIAKELLSDFKEVDDNFKTIIKEIYQKQINSTNKGGILQYTFEALDELKESSQGKSFYAFWEFLLSSELQNEWESLTEALYIILKEKNIENTDMFLIDFKEYLFAAGQKVNKTNHKMSEKLSRIIRETEVSTTELTKSVIHEIKQLLIQTSKLKESPSISFEIEEVDISLPFERKLTYKQIEEVFYDEVPQLSEATIADFENLHTIFHNRNVDKRVLRKNIEAILNKNSQVTLLQVIKEHEGLKKGLPELLGYISLVKEFTHTVNTEKTQYILFDVEKNKYILIPEIILTR